MRQPLARHRFTALRWTAYIGAALVVVVAALHQSRGASPGIHPSATSADVDASNLVTGSRSETSIDLERPGTIQADTCAPPTVTFAAIGDYGDAGQDELDVSNLVKGWNPDFVITLGDNNYPDGATSTIDENIGQYYHEFIGNYTGIYGSGAASNNFYPSLGNHDWHTTSGIPPMPRPYLDYFMLPDNERYYNVTRGPVELFAVDSDPHEPDGRLSTSTQAAWLQNQLAAAGATWKLVYMHHPPYSSSSKHGSEAEVQWPYQAWGATAVLAGHDHTYERIVVDDFPYFVNGLGGKSKYAFGTPVPGSVVRYNDDYGAMLIQASSACITFQFISRAGQVIDTYTIISDDSLIFLPLIVRE